MTMRNTLWVGLFALLAIMASALNEGTSSNDIWEVVKSQLRDKGEVPGAIEHVKTLLEELATRLKFEQQLADAQYFSLDAFYSNTLANISITARRDLERLGFIKRRMQNVSFNVEAINSRLRTIEHTIQRNGKLIGELQDKISRGDAKRAEENVRFRRRSEEASMEIEATDHIINAMGDSNGETASVKEKLALAAIQQANAKKEQTPAPAASFLELGASFGGAEQLDVLKDFIGSIFDNLHQGQQLLSEEEGHRAYRWASQRDYYRNKSTHAQADIASLESERDAATAKQHKLQSELASLLRLKWLGRQQLKRDEAQKSKYKKTRQSATDDFNAQKNARMHQMQTNDKLYNIILKHIGDSPLKLEALDRESIIRETEPILAGNDFTGLRIPGHVTSENT